MNEETAEERIIYLKKLISMMRKDEKEYGLVREDLEKIRDWNNEISVLNYKHE